MHQETSKKNLEKYVYVAVSALFGIFIYYVNSISPLLPGDDYTFSMKIPAEGVVNGERIHSLKDLIESQINFYNTYHYRILNHSILQTLLLFPKGLFNILNTVVLMLLPAIVLSSTKVRKSDYVKKYLFLLLVIWCLHFNLGWCYYQVTGALNYTWYLIPQLLYVSFLVRYKTEEKLHWSIIPLALANSLGNENATVSLFLLTIIVWFLTRKKQNYVLAISSLLLLGGGLFMLASPSLAWRMEDQGFRDGGMSGHVIEYLRRVVYYSIFYVALIGLAIYNNKSFLKTKFSFPNKKLGLLFFVFFSATGIMIAIPLFEPRSAIFGFFICLMIMAVMMEGHSLKRSLITFFILLSLILIYIRVPVMKAHQQRHYANEQILEKNRNSQNKVVLNKYCDPSNQSIVLCKELVIGDGLLDHSSVAAYYNIKNLVPYGGYNWDKVRQSFSTPKNRWPFLESYQRKEISSNKVLYYKKVENGLEIFIEYPKRDSMLHIIRGSLKGLNSHRFFDLLPLSIRIYFLSYLEDITIRQDRTINIDEERQWSLFFVDNIDLYKYLIFSEYSLDLHAPDGRKTKLDL